MKTELKPSLGQQWTVISFAIILGLVFFVSFTVGRYPLSLASLLKIVLSYVGLTSQSAIPVPDYNIFIHVRLPRILLVTFVGGALAISGGIYQGIFRNPLVSPDILGVTMGACFGAAIGILLPFGSEVTIRMFAFIFGIVAVVLAYFIAQLGKASPILMLILSGIIVSSFFGAALSLLKYIADPYQELPSIVFWIMGGFHRTSWSEVLWSLPMICVGVITMHLMRYKLNPLSLGDNEAQSLGINVGVTRLLFIAMATMVVAASVAVCGSVGWIGLVIPHLSRLIIGPHHGRMIPFSFILGALFLLLMDDFARTVTVSEIPIGIITAFFGAPLFAYFLITGRKAGWNL
ncbi:FecCD family ABC transporter permease [candidate division CSSED10-310 bacterium]|uniref:FecCD family ABC transporter permease n=1 Tax=candidate division CSSED10-310 bacterium TaxID=2855610 RepID=A0ABV6YXZ4_UNCC1